MVQLRLKILRRNHHSQASETLVDSCLLQNGVGGVSRLDLSVDNKAVLCDRAVPDLVIASTLPFKTAIVRKQEFFELRGEGRAHSGRQADLFLPLACQLEGDCVGLISGEKLIRFQQLGDHDAELLGESLDRRRFRSESGNVVARRDPDLGVGVPVGMDTVDNGSHRVKGTTGVRGCNQDESPPQPTDL